MKTAIIQIGNTDDKLSQRWWAQFCSNAHSLLAAFGQLHFNGHSEPTAQWQNACFVVEIEDKRIDELRADLSQLGMRFGQDSIALIVGDVEFI